MDQIYAKLKRLRKEPMRKLVSDKKLFDFVPVGASFLVDYNGGTLLDEESWFRVPSFSEQAFFPDFLKTELNSVDVSEIEGEKFRDITCLVALQGDDYYFQRVVPSSMLRRKFLSYGEAVHLEEPRTRISVNSVPDAIYVRGADELQFKDLARISPIFPGIDQLYREATGGQVEEFLDRPFIKLDGFDGTNVSKSNRRRITLALESLEEIQENQIDELIAYILDYSDGKLKYSGDDGAFVVSSDDDVKNLIWGIEERYYTTNIRGQKRIANSVIPI